MIFIYFNYRIGKIKAGNDQERRNNTPIIILFLGCNDGVVNI